MCDVFCAGRFKHTIHTQNERSTVFSVYYLFFEVLIPHSRDLEALLAGRADFLKNLFEFGKNKMAVEAFSFYMDNNSRIHTNNAIYLYEHQTRQAIGVVVVTAVMDVG